MFFPSKMAIPKEHKKAEARPLQLTAGLKENNQEDSNLYKDATILKTN